MRARMGAVMVLVALVSVLPGAARVSAATVPSGFSASGVVSGLARPTALAISPDGRLFVSEQGGGLRVIKNGELLATPFITLDVDAQGERGLLGVAFDPAFAENHFVYALYTAKSPVIHNRVSRFTATGDVAVPGSEAVVVDLGPLEATNHNGGAIGFGPDGKLYVATGDNANPSSAQSLETRMGKILRYDADGAVPTDNPFFRTASGANRSIWALGLRNPFSFAFQPGTGRMFINDVGENAWEEVNQGVAGANFGWPETEGPTVDLRFRSPVFAYAHGQTATTGCAVTAGAFYNPATVQFPAMYSGAYFFADYCSGWIRQFDPDAPVTSSGFVTGMGSVVDLDVGGDGTLYALTRSFTSPGGQVTAVRYGTDWDPAISAHPVDQIVAVRASVTFLVEVSGMPPVTYQWRRDGLDIPGATDAAYSLAAAGLGDDGARFDVVVTNAVGTATSRAATLHVVDGSPPAAVITASGFEARYDAGDTINYSATATDAEDGDLPVEAFRWEVVFHHEMHTHPFLPPRQGERSGAFTVPDRGETSPDVFYRVHLTVTDSDGLTHTASRDVHPNTAAFTLSSQPSGLSVTLDGHPVVTPFSTVGVVGMVRQIGAPTPQSGSGESWAFQAWSDGGGAVHEIITPARPATYSAGYRPVDGTVPTCRGRTAGVVGTGTITGTGGPDVIVGSPGNDVIVALGGDDVICGGGGWDRIAPGAGIDIVDGGAGTDTLSYELAPAGMTASLATGLASGEGADTLFALEYLVGSAFADRLDGSAAANRIWGGAGNDVLRGLGGSDRLFGEGGNDTLNGGAGSDACQQGPGTGSVTACEGI